MNVSDLLPAIVLLALSAVLCVWAGWMLKSWCDDRRAARLNRGLARVLHRV